jgi:hypothetical protein
MVVRILLNMSLSLGARGPFELLASAIGRPGDPNRFTLR